MRRTILHTAVIIFLVTFALQPIIVEEYFIDSNMANFFPSAVTVTEMNPNHDLLQEPQLFGNGDSGEFTAWHSSSERFDDYGFVQLNWTHVSGAEINTTGEERDYIGCSFSFQWSYDELPRNVRPFIGVTSTASGDYIYSPGRNYAYLRAYFIDSSGNWIQIGSSSLGFGYFAWSPYLNAQHLEDVFAGMIENSEGVQEDPSDNVTLAVVLEPSQYDFDPDSEGSFEAILHSVSIDIVRTATPNEQILSPGRETIWESTSANVNPEFAQDAESFHDSAQGLVTTADGSIFGLVYSGYSGYHSAVVLKWSENMHLDWWYRIDDIYVQWPSVAVSEDAVYVVGYTHEYDDASDIVLTKLGADGSFQWSETYDFGNADSTRSVAVDDQGLVYFLVNTGLGPRNLTLVQTDEDGVQNWAKTIPFTYGYEVACSADGRIYTHDDEYVREWSSTGVILRNSSTYGRWMLGPDGSGYGIDMKSTPDGQYELAITKRDGDAIQQWNTTYRIHYGLEKNETILPYGYAVSSNGSLFISVYLDEFALETRLLHFNANTSAFISSRLLTEDSDQDLANDFLAIAADGYLYRFRTVEYNVVLYSFSPLASGIFGGPFPTELIVVLGGVGVVVILVVAVVRRRR
ncbi:MAG: hypothetical protein EAX95_14235 [Candidatus Thorarchaeota archaeon]|nr:hypothetical protein [Candidatus Thorarchaeota archaeon]